MEFIKGLFSKTDKLYKTTDDIAHMSDHEIYDLLKNTDQISSNILHTGTTVLRVFQKNAMQEVLDIKKKIKSGETPENNIDGEIVRLKRSNMTPRTVKNYEKQMVDEFLRRRNKESEIETKNKIKFEKERKVAMLARERERKDILLAKENNLRRFAGMEPISQLGYGKRTRRNIHKNGKAKRTKNHEKIKRKNHKKNTRRV